MVSEVGRGQWIEQHRTTVRLFGVITIMTTTQEWCASAVSGADVPPDALAEMPVDEHEPQAQTVPSFAVDYLAVKSTANESLSKPLKNGQVDGIKRRRPFTTKDYELVHALTRQGLSCRQIAHQVKRSESSVRRWLNRDRGPEAASGKKRVGQSHSSRRRREG